jgi:prevent-host-death family protein
MEALSVSEAKMKLSELIERVNRSGEAIMITRNGRPGAILVSPDEFEGWRETIAIRSDPAFMEEIKAGLKALREGNAKLYTLEELFDESDDEASEG